MAAANGRFARERHGVAAARPRNADAPRRHHQRRCESNSSIRGRSRTALAGLMAGAALAGCAGEQYAQTTFRPVTEFGEAINSVFENTFWWTMALMAVVFVLVLYVVMRYRERPGQPPPRQIHGNTKLEIVWTTIPALIIVLIAVPPVRTIFATQAPAPDGALEIEVIGHQWWWEFRYPELGVVT